MTRAALILLLFLAGCTAPGGRGHEIGTRRAQARSICEIMARPDLYAGQRLLVRGIYEPTPHQRVLIDRNCGEWELALELNDHARRQEPARGTRVIYSGIFTSRRSISPCSGPECHKYTLKDSRLVGTY